MKIHYFITLLHFKFMLNVGAKLLYTEFYTDGVCIPINSST
jgi:hypothetical protein